MKPIRYYWVRFSPWAQAHLRAAAMLYRESDRWEERAMIVDPKYADETFTNSMVEINIFKRRVLRDPWLMLRVIFTPYSVHP